MSSITSTETVKRDDFFYFSNLVFQVEGTLFKVPRYGLPGDGAAFDAMFARGPGAAGSSDDDPVRLDADVTATDFRSLLKATYPPPGMSSASLTVDEWMSVLKLAKRWDLASMRNKAISESDSQIQQKTYVEKIMVARKYGVAKWLREGYFSLVKGEIASDTEIEKLGWETYGRLLKIRIEDHQHSINNQWSNVTFDVDCAIRTAFGNAVED